jgi:hypothetical protein
MYFLAAVLIVVSPASAVGVISVFIVSGVSAGIIYDLASGGTETRQIEIKQGRLTGLRLEATYNRNLKPVEVFLGIPYAAPPTGSQRFMPPGSPPYWMGLKKAHDFGPVCPQNLPDLNPRTMPESRANYLRRLFPYLLHNQSEDCLYLNIYAPAPKRGEYRHRKWRVLIVVAFLFSYSVYLNHSSPFMSFIPCSI